MKKYLILLAALVSLSANANDFSSASFGIQYGIDDGIADNAIDHAESALGGYARLSWNFYKHFFADYNISYSSFEGPSFHSSNFSASANASTTKQDFGIGYYLELGSFAPYVKVNQNSYKLNYYSVRGNGTSTPYVNSGTQTEDGYGLEFGSFIHMSDTWKVKLSGSIAKLDDVDLIETYLISDTKFNNDKWALEAAIGYRTFKGEDMAEFMPQIGVKYAF